MLGEHGFTTTTKNISAKVNLGRKQILSPTFGFVLKTKTPMEKIILPKLAAWLLAEEHCAGQHVVNFFKKLFLRGFEIFRTASFPTVFKKMQPFIQLQCKPFLKVPD